MNVKECLRLADDDEVFACVKEVIKSDQGSCPARFVLLVEKRDCEPCSQTLKEYSEEIKEGIIQVVSTTSKEGKDIIKRNKIEYAPSLLVLDCQNQIIDV